MKKTHFLASVSAMALMIGASTSAFADHIEPDSIVAGNTVFSDGNDSFNSIEGSYNTAAGVITVQQNNGSANAISAQTSVVINSTSKGDSENSVSTDLMVGDNDVQDTLTNKNIISDRFNAVRNSFIGSTGVITVQQNNGDANAMSVANAVTLGSTGKSASDQRVGILADVFDNRTADRQSRRTNSVSFGSFQSSGVITLQQNNGHSNAMSVGNSVAVNSENEKGMGSVKQRVFTEGWVENARSSETDGSTGFPIAPRANGIDMGSFNGAEGLITAQQNNGDNNAILVANAVRMDTVTASNRRKSKNDQLVTTFGHVAGESTRINARAVGAVGETEERTNTIDSAFQGTKGVVTVQQNAGDGNVIGAATGVIVSINGNNTKLADTRAGTYGEVHDLVGSNGGFANYDTNSNRHNYLSNGAFNDFEGVLTVQQNGGSSNVMGAATAVVVNIDPQENKRSKASAFARGGAYISDNKTQVSSSGADYHAERHNDIDGSFTDASGVITVQQNLGDGNVMGASTNVVSSNDDNGWGPSITGAGLSATVTDNSVDLVGVGTAQMATNYISASFNGARGVVTVAQNTGNNNAIQSAVSVVYNGSFQ